MKFIRCDFFLACALAISSQGLWAMEKEQATARLMQYLTDFSEPFLSTKEKNIDKNIFFSTVLDFIQRDANPNIFIKKAGMSLVQMAAYLGAEELIISLVKHGAKLTIKYEELEGFEESISLEDSDSSDKDEPIPPLNFAVMNKHYKVARLLLSYVPSAEERLQMYLATLPNRRKVRGEGLDIIKDLLNEGANPNVAEQRGGYRALHLAIQNKSTDLVALLLKLGADPNAKTFGGSSPLYWASARNCPSEIRTMLIDAGATT